jgi:hypothetical protein
MGVYDPLLKKVPDGPTSPSRSAWHGLLPVARATLGLALAFCALSLLSSFPTNVVSVLQEISCVGVGCEHHPRGSVVLDASEGFEDDANVLSE